MVYNPPTPGVITGFGRYSWNIPDENAKKIQRECYKFYQDWYSSSLHFTEEYLPKRAAEFIEQYQYVMNYLKLNDRRYDSNKQGIIDDLNDIFDIQRGILNSIKRSIDVAEMNLRKLITADLVESELEEAEVLFNNKYHRCAGALAGVALEKHLEILCQLNGLQYRKKDTIDPLATNLYKNKVIDITELKKIQFWGSIRNKCDHPNKISENEVKELLDGVKGYVT